MPVPTWSDLPRLAVDLARIDLELEAAIRPTLLAFVGEQLLVSVELRPHGRDELPRALVEVGALVLPLGADRLAHLAAGRMWSLEDPIVPVADGIDLRQEVAILTRVDGTSEPPRVHTDVWPYDRPDDGPPLLGSRLDLPEAPEGRVVGLLTGMVEGRHRLLDRPAAEVGGQVLRLLQLGHDLQLPGDGRGPVADCLLAALDADLIRDPAATTPLGVAPILRRQP